MGSNPGINEHNVSPIDKYSAFKKIENELGWKIFQLEVSKIGDEYLTELHDTTLVPGKSYTLRDLKAFQVEVVKKIANIPVIIKEEADVHQSQQPPPKK